MSPEVIGRFLATALFAVVFVQSALDKLTDSQGNLEFLSGHFKQAPFSSALVRRMFWTLTALESTAGVLCALGILFGSFWSGGMNLASAGLGVAGLALLSLMAGQRFAKDYAGAAVVAAYIAALLVGLAFFT